MIFRVEGVPPTTSDLRRFLPKLKAAGDRGLFFRPTAGLGQARRAISIGAVTSAELR